MKIFEVHLRKRLKNKEIIGDLDWKEDNLRKLALLTEGFVGAEIEESVVSALFEAFAEDRKLNISDLEKAIHNMVPLSVTQAEQIISIREWANVRAVAATAKEDRTEYVSEPETEEPSKLLSSNEKFRHVRGGRAIDF